MAVPAEKGRYVADNSRRGQSCTASGASTGPGKMQLSAPIRGDPGKADSRNADRGSRRARQKRPAQEREFVMKTMSLVAPFFVITFLVAPAASAASITKF